jgi:PAS domain S-box-containing protein
MREDFYVATARSIQAAMAGAPEGGPEEFVHAIADTSPAMLWMGDAEGKCVFLNGALRRFWGVDPTTFAEFDWSATLHPDDVDMLAGPFAEAMAAHTAFAVEARYRRADGVYRTMRTEANPRFGAGGTFLGMTGVNTDITDQLMAEEHTQFLMRELNHRTKNILAVVQAVARQTARSSAPDAFLETFDARLMGLSASNDLLLRNDWSGVLLDDLVAVQLAHVTGHAGQRLTVGGPPVRVHSQGAQTLGMALHELSTNSLKYGALSGPAGTVSLNWRRRDGTGWEIAWREAVSRPVAPPARKGFGHAVIVEMVRAALGAEVTLEFPPEGLSWRAVVPG